MANANVQVKKATKQVMNRRKSTHISTLRVAAYCRVSTDNKEQRESYQSQVKHYTELINKNPEWQSAGIYADEAITGTSTKKRDDFQRMINDCLNGDIDLILVKSISRFARNTLDTLQYVRMLKEKHIAVLFEEENINTSTMDGELLLTILSSVAQQEVQNISEHVKLGLSMKMQRGEMVGFNGCLGYDYNKEDKTISVNPTEAEIIRYIFNRYVEGVGCKVIARELKNLGYKNNRGNTNWSNSGVLGIIKNEKYKGDLLMGKSFTVDPISKRRLPNQGEADTYYVENHHEPIVSKELFEQAQAILQKRSGSHSHASGDGKREKFSRQYSFSSMLKCGFCGGTLSRRTWNSSYDYKKTIWHCATSTKNGKHECPYCKGIPETVIEQAFVRSYNMLCHHDQSFVDSFLGRVKQNLQEDDKGKELKSIDKEIVQLKKRKSGLVDMRLDNKVDEETYQTKLSEIANIMDKLYDRKQELQLFQTEQQDINKRLLEFQKVLNNHEVLKEFDRHVFECIIDRVVIGEKKANGEIDPYKLKFLYKTGVGNGVAVKQPFSFNSPCSKALDEHAPTYLQSAGDTYRQRPYP